ncbi:MAG: hypothetical protein QXQ14_02955 [Candidatus Aenigmatarchaeota archaeon]
MKEFIKNEIGIKSFLLIGKGFSRFISPKEVFNLVYSNKFTYNEEIIIRSSNGNFHIYPLRERKDIFFNEFRTKKPEALIVYNDNKKPIFKLVEFRPYHLNFCKYLENILNGKNLLSLIYLPTSSLNNYILENRYLPKILYRSRLYKKNDCYTKKIIYVMRELKTRCINSYRSYLECINKISAFQLSLVELVPQTLVSRLIFGKSENLDIRDFEKELFEESLRKTKFEISKIKDEIDFLSFKIFEVILENLSYPVDLKLYQIGIDKEDNIKFIDFASGFESINPNITFSKDKVEKAIKKLVYKAADELTEDLNEIDFLPQEFLNIVAKYIRKNATKVSSKLNLDLKEIEEKLYNLSLSLRNFLEMQI